MKLKLMTQEGTGRLDLLDGKRDVLALQESSSVTLEASPEACLRDEWGEASPGSSFLWLVVPGPPGEGNYRQQLTRIEAAALVQVLVTWLATGRVVPGQPELPGG